MAGRRNALPLVYLAVAAVTAALLPSSLRPPPDEASASAQLSPDAPPDEDPETIIQSLRQAASRTAGATGRDDDQRLATTTTTEPRREAGRGQCFGDPPRQFDSVYAPPCRPAFVGDNGGATAPRGVTATEIRIGLSPDLTGTRDCGEIPDTAEPGESDNTRTYRVLRDFFNENLELYGRRMRWFYSCAPDGTTGEEAERARGVRLAEEFGVFASIGEFSGGVADEATRRGVVHFANIVVVPDQFYADRFPYLWGSRTNATKAVAFGAEYACRRLNGHTPFPTGDALIDYGSPRRFGILALDAPDTNSALRDMVARMEACGAAPVAVATYNLDDNAQGIATAMSRLRAENVSTIVFMGEIITLPVHAQAADQQRYFPEWYLMGAGGFETAIVLTRTVSPTQWQNAFGFSFEEIPTRPPEWPCWRAYKSMDPANNPSDSVCNILFHSMTFLFGSIQEAGPDLNAETLHRALFRSFTRPPEPVWSMAGGFGPGDYTYGDYAVELWWDPTATHPDGQPGAYVYPRCGRRFSLESIGDGNPDYMFQPAPHNVTYGLDAGPECEARP